MVVFDEGFYSKQFDKNNVYENIGKEKVDSVNKELIGYLNNENPLVTDFFNEKEKLHLVDVQLLINNIIGFFYVVLFLLVLIFIYFALADKPEIIGRGLVIGGFFALIVLVLLALASLINFNLVFTYFHLASFNNDLWLLNPDSSLIRMFPSEFFYSAFTRILVIGLAVSALFIIIGHVIKKHPSVLKKKFYLDLFKRFFLE